MIKHLLFCLSWFALSFLNTFGQCNYPVDTLHFESFEQGMPASWNFIPTNEEGKWMLDSNGFGHFKNPGEGNWMYIDDQVRNNNDLAEFVTASYDLSAHTAFTELSFLLNFQEFDKYGSLILEMFSKGTWTTIYETQIDFEGKVIVDVKDLVGTDNRFRFSYSDGGVDGWGAGIDNFLIAGSSSICGNGICELGEDPEFCPGDCPKKNKYPDTWISKGKDLFGKPVTFSNFSGNRICDDCSQEVDLGFPFKFYENSYSKVYINSNGNLSFGEDFINYVPQSFCLDGAEMIAPFFSDVDLSKGGSISFYKDPENHYALIFWEEVAFFGCENKCDLRNSYQVILTDASLEKIGDTRIPAGTNVLVSYGDMQWTGGAASGGYLGFGGSAATVGINSGQGGLCEDYGVFDNSGFAFFGKDIPANCTTNGVNHLDYKHLFFDANKGELAHYKGISSFSAAYSREGIELEWKVDFVDVEGLFVLERMSTGEEYLEVAILHIDIDDTENQLDTFSFTDENVIEGDYSYRISYLGESSISYQDSVQVQFFDQVEFGESVRDFAIVSYGPNPLKDYLKVILAPRETETALTITYALVDMAGNEYVRGELMINEQNFTLEMETHDLPAGLYVLIIRSINDKQYIRLAKN